MEKIKSMYEHYFRTKSKINDLNSLTKKKNHNFEIKADRPFPISIVFVCNDVSFNLNLTDL